MPTRPRFPDDEWQRIQGLMPIACVDALAIRGEPAGDDLQVGLILRDTPDEGRRWCLIGGRILYGESIAQALTRHVKDSLGGAVRFETTSGDQPLYVAQYAPDARPGFARDVRRHAVGLTFAIALGGDVRPAGAEALDFGWFPATGLAADEVGFGQMAVINAVVARLRT